MASSRENLKQAGQTGTFCKAASKYYTNCNYTPQQNKMRLL